MSIDDLFYHAWRRIVYELLKDVPEEVRSGIRELLLLMEQVYREQRDRADEAEKEAERMRKRYLAAIKKQVKKADDEKTDV